MKSLIKLVDRWHITHAHLDCSVSEFIYLFSILQLKNSTAFNVLSVTFI